MSSQKSSAAPRQPQRQRGHDRVVSLLEAAGQVFAEKGYEGATMTEIAARAGASIGSLYQFFPTRDLLAGALMGQYTDALIAHLDELDLRARDQNTEELGAALIRGLVEFRLAHPAFGLLAESRAIPGELVADVRKRFRARIQATLTGHAPSLSPSELRAMATVVVQFMKAAVALSTEAVLPGRKAALEELKIALQVYLRVKLAAG
jgi:AcrR family transcriptional regulator